MNTPSKYALFGVRKKLRKLLETEKELASRYLVDSMSTLVQVRKLKAKYRALKVLVEDKTPLRVSINQVKEFIQTCSSEEWQELHGVVVPRSVQELRNNFHRDPPKSEEKKGGGTGFRIADLLSGLFGTPPEEDIKTASDNDLLALCKRIEALPTNRRSPRMKQALEACKQELLNR
jgi:hypothetical protein